MSKTLIYLLPAVVLVQATFATPPPFIDYKEVLKAIKIRIDSIPSVPEDTPQEMSSKPEFPDISIEQGIRNFFDRRKTDTFNTQLTQQALEDLKLCLNTDPTCPLKLVSTAQLLLTLHIAEKQTGQKNTDDFLTGLIKGLAGGKDNQCSLDLTQNIQQLEDLLVVLREVLQGNLFKLSEVYKLAKGIYQEISGIKNECNFNGLMEVLKSFRTIDGWVALTENFVENFMTIIEKTEGIKDCSTDYGVCGEDLGTVVSLLLNWTL